MLLKKLTNMSRLCSNNTLLFAFKTPPILNKRRSLSTFGVFDNKEKAEEGKWIRDQEKHQRELETSSEDAQHSKDVNMHVLDVGRSEILHILLDSGEPLSKTTVDKIIWSLFTEFKKILK